MMVRFTVLFLLLITTGTLVMAQNLTALLTGQVVTSAGSPAEGATVRVKGTTYGTTTTTQGRFSLTVPAGRYLVVVSTVGFVSQERSVVLVAGKPRELIFSLREDNRSLEEATVTGVRTITGMGYLAETSDNIIYSGKKTEVVLLDSLDANTAQNNPRQVLGRVPGANYSETEGSGFPSNGIGFRGLNPTQSIETNTRQNGYNITADLYGYPETYYLPPLEAVERIEVTRGASSLQFGPQFGGVINYVMRRGNTTKPIEVTTQQTGGSFGLFNSFNSVGGQVGKLNYYGFVQYQGVQGWRPNSQTQKVSAFGRLAYQVNNRLTIGVEYSLLRNRIQMAGGLTDEQFQQDSRASYRARNWLKSPWNIFVLTADYRLSDHTTLTLRNTTNVSARDLVWRNEDGGPGTLDTVDPLTNDYVSREVEHEGFKSNTTELRSLTTYRLGKTTNTLAMGVRFFTGKMKRQEGGTGTTGSDFNMALVSGYETDLDFTTTNIAPFVENTFRLSDKLSITPGVRYEYLNSTVKGYSLTDDESGNVISNRSKNRYIFLAGVGAQYKTTPSTNIYANWSQAYRPTDYSSLTPFGTIATVNPNLKDASGYNADLGFRGSVRNYLNFDIGGFYLQYNNRIGLIEITDAQGNQTPYRTNVANSVHKGMESYVEFNPVKAFAPGKHWILSFFNSLALIDAKYTSGDFDGKSVEYAPKVIERFGTTVAVRSFSTTFLISHTGQSFGDASNAVTPSEDAVSGLIPAYTVLDWSGTMKLNRFNVKFGANNLADKRYFTLRTSEYPGPGIIPSIGRSFYVGLGATF